MTKLITILTTSSFFAIACSSIDQLVWHNELSWPTIIIGFITGFILALLSGTNENSHYSELK